MEKYDAENARPDVVDVLPLMRILLLDAWVPSTGEMPVWGYSVLCLYHGMSCTVASSAWDKLSRDWG